MSIALFFIASLLIGIFQIHSRVVGNFVLQEALERYVFLAEEETERQLEEGSIKYLRGFFNCGDARLQIEETGKRKKGKVETAVETEISVKEYQPESTLRFWAVLTAESREEEDGSSLQERNEP